MCAHFWLCISITFAPQKRKAMNDHLCLGFPICKMGSTSAVTRPSGEASANAAPPLPSCPKFYLPHLEAVSQLPILRSALGLYLR